MTFKQRLAAILTFVGIGAGSLAIGVGIASAHNGNVTAGCVNNAPVATANLTNYNGTNTITIKNNGVELTAGTFGASLQQTYSLGDAFIAHTVVYKVTAHDDPNNAQGFSPGGTIQVPACKTPVSTAPGVTFTDPTCAAPTATVSGQLNTDKVNYAQTGTVAPGGSVTVTATPKAGFTFTPNPTIFTHNFPAVPDCRVISTPVAPTATTSEVCATLDTYTAGPTAGVLYNGQASVTGSLTAGQVVNIVATPAPGFKFAGELQTKTYTVTGGTVEVCTVVTTTPPTTIPETTTTVPASCIYDASLPADSPLCVAPTTTTVPVPPTAPPTVSIPPDVTLPRTGTGSGGIAFFGALFLVAGILALTIVRRKPRNA